MIQPTVDISEHAACHKSQLINAQFRSHARHIHKTRALHNSTQFWNFNNKTEISIIHPTKSVQRHQDHAMTFTRQAMPRAVLLEMWRIERGGTKSGPAAVINRTLKRPKKGAPKNQSNSAPKRIAIFKGTSFSGIAKLNIKLGRVPSGNCEKLISRRTPTWFEWIFSGAGFCSQSNDSGWAPGGRPYVPGE